MPACKTLRSEEHTSELQSREKLVCRLLPEKKKPIAILGGTRWDQQAVDQFADIAERHDLPVAVQYRRQMLCSTAHPCVVGDVGLVSNPEVMRYIKEADLVLLVGGRMSVIASQSYTLFNIPVPAPTLVFVFPDAAAPEIYTLSLHDALPI